MLFCVLIILFLITKEGYIFIPKYFFLRKRGLQLNATVVELVNAKNSFGLIAKVDYSIQNKEFHSILPVYSSFVAEMNFTVGNEVLMLVNPTKHEECVIKSDIILLLQLCMTGGVYAGSIYYFMSEMK